MPVMFYSEGVNPSYFITCSKSAARSILTATEMMRYSSNFWGKCPHADLPKALDNFENALANPSILRRYTKEFIVSKPLQIEYRQESNVIKLRYGEADTEPLERDLRRKLALLYILAVAALDSGHDLRWREIAA